MKTRLIFLIILNCIIFKSAVFAKEVPVKIAKQIAINLYCERAFIGIQPERDQAIISEEYIISHNSSPLFYIFNIDNNKGFIIISADDGAYPVLGYSLQGRYNQKNIPAAFSSLLNNYKEQITFIKNNNLSGTSIIDSLWENYSSKNFVSSKYISNVTPLINTHWGQGCYYNDSCPAQINVPPNYCGHVPTGCVATAMAQIMKFHLNPIQGTGSFSYNNAPYGTLSANFGASTYNWSNMPNSISFANADIAQLMYHCGVAVHTNYAAGSGATATNAKNALINYFNYAATAQLASKGNYSNNSWENLLRNELDSARPIFYSGFDPNGPNHAFICDGYQFSNHFHFNWGWDGQFDGYYLLSSLNPGTSNFTNSQEAIIRIKSLSPNPVAHFTANKTAIAAGDTAFYTDMSTGNPTSWAWSFSGGNPSSSNQQNPPGIKYNTPGTYTVSLTVSNAYGSDIEIKTNYLTVSNDVPEAEFSSNRTSVAVAGCIDFTDLSSCIVPVTSWSWTFTGGTPTSSNLQNPTNIIYNSTGIYTVSLTVSNTNGSDTKTKTGYVIVYTSCDTLFNYPVPTYYLHPSNQGSFSISTEDLDGNTPLYAGSGHTSNWMMLISTDNTNRYRGATSMFSPPGQADNWLEFGPVTIPPGIDRLILDWDHSYMGVFYNKRDGYEVKLNSSGLDHTHYISPAVFSVYDNDPLTDCDTSWTKQSVQIDLSMYGGQQLYFAFHHNANDMSYLFIDNVCLHYYDIATSIDEINQSNNMSIYPNPASKFINVKFDKAIQKNLDITIIDVNGKKVKSLNYQRETISIIQIDISDMSKGIYFVNFQNNQSKFTKKLVVIK